MGRVEFGRFSLKGLISFAVSLLQTDLKLFILFSNLPDFVGNPKLYGQ